MLQISNATGYSLRAVLALVQSYENNKVMTITGIAAAEEIPEAFLRKLLRSLINAGIVESKRGYSGGIRLAKPPADITVLDVVEAVEGRMGLNECVTRPSICEFVEDCPMHEVWTETTERVRDQLKTYSMSLLHDRSLEYQARESASSGEPQ